jgi:hypothetical protein
MSEFISAFKEVAEKVTWDCPSDKCEWTSEPNKPKETLTIHKLDENGFDVRLECESYGLYPFAGGWHGAPWVKMGTPDKKMLLRQLPVKSWIRWFEVAGCVVFTVR